MTSIGKLLTIIVFLFLSFPAHACFGPKLYVGTEPGIEGELLFHLVTIYIKEKTGVESIRVEFSKDENSELLLQQEKIDFGFSGQKSNNWPHMLKLGETHYLLHGPRPAYDLQFTTVPKALTRLQKRITNNDFQTLSQQVSAGELPARVVRQFYMKRGWI